MKKLFLSLIALVLPLLAGAQVTEAPTATLIHGDETKVFYGSSALTKAYDAAAQEGDKIVLSPGVFNTGNKGLSIQKSIAIYGAGMEGDNITTITSDISIRPYEYYDDYGDKHYRFAEGIHIEGLNFSNTSPYSYFRVDHSDYSSCVLKGLELVKCRFYGFHLNCANENVTIRQCIDNAPWNEPMSLSSVINKNLNIYNCYLHYIYQSGSSESTINVDHCVINGTIAIAGLFTNNIIKGDLKRVTSYSTAYNNIFFYAYSDVIDASNVTSSDNWFSQTYEGIFTDDNSEKHYRFGSNYNIKYPLKYVGTDGTVVGPTGGLYPWNITPVIPRITASEIDTYTSADGKLKVNITVEAQATE